VLEFFFYFPPSSSFSMNDTLRSRMHALDIAQSTRMFHFLLTLSTGGCMPTNGVGCDRRFRSDENRRPSPKLGCVDEIECFLSRYIALTMAAS
jgi:hypothetical protein